MDSPAGTIFLARHGETDDNAAGRVQGAIDTRLNERGREQALKLAQAAKRLRILALYSSALRRAYETAEIIGEELGLEPQIDARFDESRRGTWEGRLLRDIEHEEPEAWARWRRAGADFRFPGGESLSEHAARVASGLRAVAAGPLPALVVCHGGSIRCALAMRNPRGLDAFNAIAVPNGALLELAAGGGEL